MEGRGIVHFGGVRCAITCPSDLDECEDLEYYEPGGFHPVHLGDVYDNRYRVVYKLFFGGFSTVWLARDTLVNRWVALKIVIATESSTYNTRSVIAGHPGVVLPTPPARHITESESSLAGSSDLFITVDRQFWIDGPNGRHLCLVYPALGPDLSRLSRGIYSRLKPDFARQLSLQAAQALVQLHSNGLCHGDFTASNILLRLTDEFDSYEEDDLLTLFRPPQTAPLQTYSGKPPRPHGPDYIVEALNFCSSSATVNVLSSKICVIDFDQSFTTTSPPQELPGIPAKYLAPEVAVGLSPSPASDVWALGCAIFRIRTGDDIFFDYDTNCPADALREIAKAMGPLSEEWKQTRFSEDGLPVTDPNDTTEAKAQPEEFEILVDSRPLANRVRDIIDEPAGLFINTQGEEEPEPEHKAYVHYSSFIKTDGPNKPYAASLRSMLWKPTAVCMAGNYFAAYCDLTDVLLKSFPRMAEPEASVLIDLLSKIFTYDPAARPKAKDLLTHPWFHI
ncbi:hypothetical protein DV735_g3524, partial [Chaetothyriales sp. CBS 134920]